MVTPFDRFHPAFGGFFAGCLIMAGAFATVGLTGYDPMPSALYGNIGSASALIMAALQGIAAGVGLYGCFRRSRFWAGLGGAALGVLFVILASEAATVLPNGAAVMAMSFGAAPLSFSITFYSWGARRGGE